MSEIAAALIGAMVSALLMVLGNRSNKRQGDIREIFHRLNAIDTVSYTHLRAHET